MSSNEATVAAIWRYPVKSMLGEELDVSAIGERGLAGDRAYALVDVETGNIVSAKNPRRWGTLFECRARYLESPDPAGEVPPVRITMADGTTVRSDDADVADVLSRALGRRVRLTTQAPAKVMIEQYVPHVVGVVDERDDTVSEGQIALLAPAGTFFDCAPVHVVTSASLAALAAAYPGGRFDPRRFRPNVFIDAGADASGFVENAWVNRTLRVGPDVALHIVLSVPRCVMTTLAQDELPADKGILQTIARENRFEIRGLGPSSCVGVYGVVATGGALSRGDRVGIVSQ
ncbi:MAG: MOSC domain-containing protein [Acidimicrobiia bacterium]